MAYGLLASNIVAGWVYFHGDLIMSDWMTPKCNIDTHYTEI